MVLFMMVSGVVLWWKRRPKNTGKLGSPTASLKLSRTVRQVMLALALCFPLSALALVLLIIVDVLFISRFKRLKNALN